MRTLSVPILLLPLAACAGASTDYPSLAIRDVERLRAGENDYSNPAAPLTALPQQTVARLAGLRADALAAHLGFGESLGRAQPLVSAARGAPVTSDNWARAQIALGDLSSQRSAMAVPLTDIELLYAETHDTGVDASSVERVREEIVALQRQQDSALAALRSRMAR